MIEFFIFLISLLAVIVGAEWLLAGAVSLARILRISEMVIGATVVSLITTMPENLVAFFGGIEQHSFLALGNVVGTGLVNLGLIFGLTLFFGHQETKIHLGKGRRRSLILFFLVFLLFLYLLIFERISPFFGLVLIIAGISFLIYTFWYSLKEARENLEIVEEKIETHPKVVLKLLIGAIFLILGAKFLLESAVLLAKILSVPEVIIGLTLVALGTSLPELVTALTALVKHHERISRGNLTGATILTLTLALGLTAIFKEVKISRELLIFDFLPLLFFCSLVMLINFKLNFHNEIIRKLAGAVLILGYFFYLGFVFYLR